MLEQQLTNFALLGAGWVLWVLVALSVVCIAVAVERTVYAAMNRSPTQPFQQALSAFLGGGESGALEQSLSSMKGLEARVLGAGIEASKFGGAPAAEEAISGTMIMERVKLERGLIILGTIGSNAPFIGLFGTVLGIIQAFHNLSLESAEGAAGVMAGISEALVATAIGLLVAIPAVILFNWFSRRNKELMAQVESLSHLMLSRLKSTPKGA